MKSPLALLLTGCLALLIIFPLFLLLVWSVANQWPWPHLAPEQWSLRGWRYVFDPSFQAVTALKNSMRLSLTVTLVTLLLSVPAARALALYEFKGKPFLKLFFLTPLFIPLTSIGMGIQIHFIRIGLADTFWGVVLINLLPCLPYAMQILTEMFAVTGDKYEQQAKVLGASATKTFLYVTLPLIMPGLVATGTIVFIIAFSDFFLTFIIGSGTIITYALLLFPFIQNGDRTVSSVLSLIFIAILFCWVIVLELLSRYYRRRQYFFH
jgi:putative spermidine/putrescine transport system permease protein